MKLPRVAQDVNVPGPGRQPYQPSPSNAVAIAQRGVAAAAADLSESVGSAARAYRKQEEAEALRQSRIEADDFESQFLITVSKQRHKLSSETDPEQYVRLIEESLKGAQDEFLKRAKQPYTREILSMKLNNHVAAEMDKAGTRAEALKKDRTTASATRTIDNYKLLAGQVALNDDATFAEYTAKVSGVLSDATPELGADAAEKLRISTRDEMFTERAERNVRENPDGFLKDVDTRYDKLDPRKRNQLVKSAEGAIETRTKHEAAEWDKWFTRVEKEAEAERQTQLTGLQAEASAGTLTVQKLDDARRVRIVTSREEYAVLYHEATREREVKSDPGVLRAVDLAVHRQVPTISDADIDALYLKDKLNRKDWLAAKEKALARRGAIADTEQGQAEQLLHAAVGKGPMDSYDDEDGQLLSVALRELTSRSRAFPEYGGKESPLQVAKEIADRIAPIRQERLKMSADKIGRTLMFPAASAAEAMARLNEKRATLPKSVVDAEDRKIADMTRAEFAAGGGNAKASTGTSGKGGGKPLRKPGTKPETGKADD